MESCENISGGFGDLLKKISINELKVLTMLYKLEENAKLY